MRTAIFDLDGTLADTSADLIAAANACFADAGFELLDPLADKAIAFGGGRTMLRARIGDEDFEGVEPPGDRLRLGQRRGEPLRQQPRSG